MPLFVKRLTETAILPTRAYPTDAGLDLYADERIDVPAHSRAWVSTGIAVAIDASKVGLVWPRSGLAGQGLTVDAGVVDSGYRGEVKVLMVNHTYTTWTVHRGDKIAQMLIQQVDFNAPLECDEWPATDRGTAGFGSTDA